MADTKQLRILKALTVLLEGITVAHGCDFDLEGHVFRGVGHFGDDEALPFISILEAPRLDEAPVYAGYEKLIRHEQWEILIQGWCKAEDSQFPTDTLYLLKGNVEKRLARIGAVTGLGNAEFVDDYRLGGLVTDIQVGPGVVRAATPQTGGAEAFYLPLMLAYVTNVADPWA